MTNLVKRLNESVSADSYLCKQAADRIRELESLISSGLQNLSGREVADALIESVNMRDRIRELEAKLGRVKKTLHKLDRQARLWSTTQEERHVINLFREALDAEELNDE